MKIIDVDDMCRSVALAYPLSVLMRGWINICTYIIHIWDGRQAKRAPHAIQHKKKSFYLLIFAWIFLHILLPHWLKRMRIVYSYYYYFFLNSHTHCWANDDFKWKYFYLRKQRRSSALFQLINIDQFCGWFFFFFFSFF